MGYAKPEFIKLKELGSNFLLIAADHTLMVISSIAYSSFKVGREYILAETNPAVNQSQVRIGKI